MSQRSALFGAARRVLFNARPGEQATTPPVVERAIQEFVFDLGEDRTGVTLLKKSEEGYRVRMRYLRGGIPSMEDSRRFKMDADDLAATIRNGTERIAKKFIPQIYDHGWDSGIACGKWLSCDGEGGDFWAEVLLDEEAFRGAVAPGLNWFGRSLGFQAWIDEDGYIRPVAPVEGSFTNFPAMAGLGGVQEMSVARERFKQRATSTVIVPAALADGANTNSKPDGGARSDVDPKNPSPVAASHGKEQEMKFSLEFLRSLGLDEKATVEDVEKRMQEREKERVSLKEASEKAAAAAPPAKPEPKPETATEKPAMVSLAEVNKIVEEKVEAARKSDRETITAELAKAERAKKVDTLLERATKEGRVLGNEEEQKRFRSLIEKDPEAFEALLPNLAIRVPVPGASRFFTNASSAGAGAPTPSVSVFTRSGDESRADHAARLTELAQLADEHDVPISQVEELIRAGALKAPAAA